MSACYTYTTPHMNMYHIPLHTHTLMRIHTTHTPPTHHTGTEPHTLQHITYHTTQDTLH